MTGYKHSCRYINFMGGYYEIGWSWDANYRGTRLRFSRKFRRITDEAGAKKFCQKWQLTFPSNMEGGIK